MPSNTIQYNQSNFNRGEIDSLISARFDYEDYDKALKRARNCITLPQGAITRRFGSKVVANYTTITDPTQIDVATILYDDSATFVVVFYPTKFDVYIENTLFQSAATSPYQAADIINLRFSQAGNDLVITHPNYLPTRMRINSPGTTTTATITSGGATNIICSAASFNTGQIFPLTFLASVPLMSPVIYTNRTYWARAINTTSFYLYDTPENAAQDVSRYGFVSATSNVLTYYPAWSIASINVINYPAYDFTAAYFGPTFTFSVSAASGTIGTEVTITSSSAIFTAAHVGGLFSGSGGILRITTFTDTTHIKGYTIENFPGSAFPLVIPGALCFLGEPAWSAPHGYPRCSTAFQGRLFFAGSPSIPNGLWGSVVNNYNDFDDSAPDPDLGISYYPASGNVTFIQSLTAARSLLVHTNTGTFSTALSTEQPLTPGNISLTEQNKDGCSELQPVFIDNQVLYVDKSHNNVKNLIWELSQSSYILRNISIVSSSLIRKPVDLANYSNPLVIDGSYVLIVNGDGTLATFNTLYMENVAGWTLQNTYQWRSSDGSQIIDNQYVHVASSFERIWFLVKRYLFNAAVTTNISSFNELNKIFTVSTSFTVKTDQVWKCTFPSPPPTTDPQVIPTQSYYARQLTATTFQVYPTYQDSLDLTNAITPETTGTLRLFEPYATLSLEELDFNIRLDGYALGSISGGTFTFNNTAFNTLYSGQSVYIYVNEGEGVEEGGAIYPLGYALGPYEIDTGSYSGLPVDSASFAYVGYPFKTEVQFLPININLVTGANFYNQKSLRKFYLYYYQTITAKINDVTFATINLQDYPLGTPPVPQTGIVNFPPMLGWEPLDQAITVTQETPFDLYILGYSAAVELT